MRDKRSEEWRGGRGGGWEVSREGELDEQLFISEDVLGTEQQEKQWNGEFHGH